MAPQKIFFSYSRVDSSEFAASLANDLRNAGANIWIDQLDIHGGKKWDVEIENALKSSDCVLFLISEKSVVSDNVLDEVYFAIGEQKQVIPVVLNKCPTPYRVRRLHQIDFTKDYNEGFSQLLKALNIEPQAKSETTGFKEKPKQDTQLFSRLKKPFIITIISFIAVILLAIILNKTYNKTKNKKINDQVSRADTTNKNLTNDELSATGIENLPAKINLAKQYFDNGKVDSGTAILYNSVKKRVMNGVDETVDSCLVTDDNCYYKKGLKRYQQKKFIPAFIFFSIGARTNDKAMCMLGNMYYSGKWVKTNLKEAYSWYSRAAGNNNSVALLMLGLYNLEGRLFPRDIAKAKEYFKKVIMKNDNNEAIKVAKEKLKTVR